MAASRASSVLNGNLSFLRTRAYSCLSRRCLGSSVPSFSNSSPSDGVTAESSDTDQKVTGFAKAFEKYTDPQFLDEASGKKASAEPKKAPAKFTTLLRNCKLMQIGDPEGAVVVGEIYHVVGDDLYVDFGWKFPCVVKKPARNPNAFVRGAKVRLRINDLELSTRFLGSPRDLTLLEADCTLLGLISTPVSTSTTQSVTGGSS